MVRFPAELLAAVVVFLGTVGVFVGAVYLYAGGPTSTIEVTVRTDRIGLVLDENADVKMRGVVVGHVAHIDQNADGASLVLAVRSDRADDIPADATVRIDSSTVFGAKFVSFDPPAESVATQGSAIRAGDTVESSNVTVELNTVFENLTSVLSTVQPQKLSDTLGAFSTALRGRGDRLGTMIEQADGYVSEANARTEQLVTAIDGADGTAGVYADAAPDLVSVLAQATSLSDTVVDQEIPLDATLGSLLALGDTGGAVLEENSPTLNATLDTLLPTTGTLAQYSPMFPCLFNGFAFSGREGAPSYVGQPGIKLQAGLLPGASTYTAANNLPRVDATGGPFCVGLDDPNLTDHAPYVVTDVNANPFNPLQRTPQVNVNSLVEILYGVVPAEGAG